MSANPRRQKNAAFTLVELLVVIVVLGVLATLAIPAVSSVGLNGKETGTLNNARQLQIATQMMSLDTANSGRGMEWTMQAARGGAIPVPLATYFGALTTNNYLTERDLEKLLTAPGIGPGWHALNAGNIAFKFFQFDEAAPSDQPFVVTANWQDRELTNEAPYGRKHFVVFTKGGSGGVYNRQSDASSTNIFPTGSRDGHPYRYITLK